MRQIRLEDYVKARCPYVEVKEFSHGVEFIRCQRNGGGSDLRRIANTKNHSTMKLSSITIREWLHLWAVLARALAQIVAGLLIIIFRGIARATRESRRDSETRCSGKHDGCSIIRRCEFESRGLRNDKQ